jgi:hypothetical protein
MGKSQPPIIIETDNIADIKGDKRGKVEPNGYEDTHRTTKIGIMGPDQFIDKVEKMKLLMKIKRQKFS